MYCPNCGTKNNYYHRFCFLCGTRLVEEEGEDITKIKDDTDFIEDSSLEIDNIQADKLEESADKDKESVELEGEKEEEKEQEEKEEKKIDEDDFFSELSQPTFDIDLSYIDYQEDDLLDDFDDLNQQMPLRRYHRDSGKVGSKGLLKAGLLIAFIALLGLLLVLVGKAIFSADKPAKASLDLSYEIEDIILEGEEGKKITFTSENAQIITISSDDINKDAFDLPFTNGSAVYTLLNSDFVYQDVDIENSQVNISLTVVAKADDYSDRVEKIAFKVPVIYAPLTLIQPASGQAHIEGDSYQVQLKVSPNSDVFINDNSYSHLIDNEGNLNVTLEIPDLSEIAYKVRVTTPGYEDNEKTIKFIREMMDFPLMVDQKLPIEATEDWVMITGKTDPKAQLTVDRQLREDPQIDPESGEFVIYVEARSKGYTPLTLTASMEGLEDSRLDLVIDRVISSTEYTQVAWAPDYDLLKNNENMQAGRIYLFTGTVKSINSTGTKSILIVETGSSTVEKPIYVEYWGSDSFAIGQNIRVYGNRWGNKDGIPRLLAKYIYKS